AVPAVLELPVPDLDGDETGTWAGAAAGLESRAAATIGAVHDFPWRRQRLCWRGGRRLRGTGGQAGAPGRDGGRAGRIHATPVDFRKTTELFPLHAAWRGFWQADRTTPGAGLTPRPGAHSRPP